MTNLDTVHPRELATGKYTNKVHGGPELILDASGMNITQREHRHAALLETGFIPAVSGRAELSGTGTARVSTWWNSHFVRAEYRPDAKGYPQMPDDETPSHDPGNSLSGERRTHRMRYAGKDVAIRMPSATAIKRFSKTNTGTFDVPVTATFGTENISGWVRVTKHGVAEWSAEGLNFPGGDALQVAEAVSAVLEARRPSTALRDAGDLLKRRADRISSAGQKIQPFGHSSFVAAAGYDRKHGILGLKLKNRLYGYKATPARVRAFSNSTSPGSGYNHLFKGTETAEIIECLKCNRFNVPGDVHRCPSRHKPVLDVLIEATIAARKAAIKASR